MLVNWLRAVQRAAGHTNSFWRQRPPIAVLDYRASHHGAHSGYRIARELGPSVPRGDRVFPHPLKTLISSLKGDPFWEERLTIHLMLRAAGTRVLHVVDGDFNTWFYEKRPAWSRCKITATFHQPADRLARIAEGLRPGMLDGIVCVSRDQIPVLKHLVPGGGCTFIPHGVDTEFFGRNVKANPDEQPLVLSVGCYLRDFKSLIEAARIIRERRPDAKVLLVAPREYSEGVAREGILETISDVSDVELRALYQKARLLLMPLEAATANNALLEAMATGCPAVVTDLPSVHDYTTSDAAIFCPKGDAQAYADAVISLLHDEARCRRMGLAARSAARRLSWQLVSQLFAGFLERVATS
jgi:glycosyltransferase involved in cell wall biosynthesis